MRPSASVVWDYVSLSRASTPRLRKDVRCSECSPSWPNCNENSSSPTPATDSPPPAPAGEQEEDARSSPPDQAHHAQQLYDAGTHTVQRIADLLQVPRSTIYGHLDMGSIGRRPTAKATLEA